jgi:hypothetical protein
MKKLISITVAFILMLMVIGCATMTAEQGKETYPLRSSVGNQPFVGGSGTDTRGLMVPDISH